VTIVDIHGHVGTWHDFFLPEPSAQWLVSTSARIGIAATGVSHLVAIGYDTLAGNRMALAAASRHAGRLGVWLVANPHRPHEADVLADQLSLPGVWGIKLHPDVHEHPITGHGYEPYLRLAEEHRVPVLSHGQTRSPWSDPALIAEVSRLHGGIDLLVGHAGLWVDGFERAAYLAAEHPRLHLETCGSRLTDRWLERIVEIAGARKVLFGTDACFLDPRIGLGKVLYARLDPGERDLVLGGNALRMLGERYLGGGE
jgi:uncharacterized protein